MPQLSAHDIYSTVHEALVVHGANEPAAASVATAVAEAESRGNRICGLYYVESYCQQLVTGRVHGDVTPDVSRPKPGIIAVDARFGFAQVAFDAGIEPAVAASQENGTAVLAIGHSHTCTSLGYFTRRLAERGVIALGATNSTARVAPPGGASRLLGTNPMSFAVPGEAGNVAMLFDWSTAATALGTITMAAAADDQLPPGLAIDRDGVETTNPHEALDGSLLSAAGYKGYGLGLMVEVLAAALTGSLASTEIPPLKAPEGPHHDIGQTYLLVDPSSFDSGFGSMIATLTASVERDRDARVPGTTAPNTTAIDVPDELWAKVAALTTRR